MWAGDVRCRGRRLALLEKVGEVPDSGEVAVDGLLASVLARQLGREVLRKLSDLVQIQPHHRILLAKYIAVGALFWTNSAVEFSVSAGQIAFVGRVGLEPTTNGL